MELNWAALADEIDRGNGRAASAAFSPLGGPVVSSNVAVLIALPVRTRTRHKKAGLSAVSRLMAVQSH
jgi:hypothetical protein